MRRTVAAVLVLAVGGAFGCRADREEAVTSVAPAVAVVATAPPTTSAPIMTVGVIGDSITVGAEPEIRRALSDVGLEVVAFDAQDGRRITEEGAVDAGVTAARRVAEVNPDLWIVALGTNDVFDGEDRERVATMVDELLAEIPPDAPLVWVDVYVDDEDDDVAALNDVLRDRAAARGTTEVVSWADVADDSDLLYDGVHPTDAGNVAFAGVVAAGAARWLD